MTHKHSHNTTGLRLLITVILNILITVAEIVGGIISGSLALISDALHNFSDAISVIISYIAIKLKLKDNSYKHTFGFKRAEILAAVINSSVLVAISIYLFYEAILRFQNPEPIKGNLMIIVALMGLVANIVGTMLLKRDAATSINIKSSYLHLLTDAISSAAVILGGLAILFWNFHWVDPVLTILIAVYITQESFKILSDAVHILMEGAPTDISIKEIQSVVEGLEDIEDIHHVHIWTVGENDIHLEAHINVPDMTISKSNVLGDKIEKLLKSKFNISHITLQFECNQCKDAGLVVNGKH
ncbi:cation diffusion facilitator family transporter [bacterium BMS3Abin03]|jgi:cobalt-zinc-cadmium efflux system protein|nr:cation diffusion facilitator family transporter [bacterium BMS3Abin03]MCG6961502.1 cation diffusion facilitator family transporter [bacterium BMS3Abin03]